MNRCFGYDVLVETIAEVDWVYIVTDIPSVSSYEIGGMELYGLGNTSCSTWGRGSNLPFQIAVHDSEEDL